MKMKIRDQKLRMTRKYLNRSLISKTGMSFRIKMAANESSPYNPPCWLLPPAACSFPTVSICFIAFRCCLLLVPLVAVSVPPAPGERGFSCLGCEASALPLQGLSGTEAELQSCSQIIKNKRCCSANTALVFSRTAGRMPASGAVVGVTSTRRVFAVVLSAPSWPFRSAPLI